MSISNYILSSGAVAQEQVVLVGAQNVVHANTGGYRKIETPFLTYTSNGTDYGVVGVPWSTIVPGPLMLTTDPYVMALQGPGLFALEGGLFTRSGRFKVSPDGELTTEDEIPFVDEGGERIVIPTGQSFQISSRGEVITADGNLVATLGIFTFDDERTLERRGAILFAAGDQTPVPAVDVHVLHKYQEGANTSAVESMLTLQEAVRAYQHFLKLSGELARTGDASIQKILKVS